MRKLALIASLLLLTPGLAQAKSLEELLVEKGVITKSEAQAHSNGSNVFWDGGTRIEFPETGFDVQVNTQLQTRYEFNDGDSDFGLDNASSFEVHRAKLVLSGHVLNKQFTYMMETSFQGHFTEAQARQFGGDRSPALQDAWIQWQPCDNGHLKLGQFKPSITERGTTTLQKCSLLIVLRLRLPLPLLVKKVWKVSGASGITKLPWVVRFLTA